MNKKSYETSFKIKFKNNIINPSMLFFITINRKNIMFGYFHFIEVFFTRYLKIMYLFYKNNLLSCIINFIY